MKCPLKNIITIQRTGCSRPSLNTQLYHTHTKKEKSDSTTWCWATFSIDHTVLHLVALEETSKKWKVVLFHVKFIWMYCFVGNFTYLAHFLNTLWKIMSYSWYFTQKNLETYFEHQHVTGKTCTHRSFVRLFWLKIFVLELPCIKPKANITYETSKVDLAVCITTYRWQSCDKITQIYTLLSWRFFLSVFAHAVLEKWGSKKQWKTTDAMP